MAKKTFKINVHSEKGAYNVVVEADYYIIDENGGHLNFIDKSDNGLVASFREWLYVI